MKNPQYYYQLIILLLSRRIDHESFCELFEVAYREWITDGLKKEEIALLDNVFDVAVMYSNSETDRKMWTWYKSEKDIDDKIWKIIAYIDMNK